MKSDSPQQNDMALRSKIADLVFGSDKNIEEEISTMSDKELLTSLVESGIDNNATFETMQHRLRKSIGQMRLSAASERLRQSEQRWDVQKKLKEENSPPLWLQGLARDRLSQRMGSGAAAFFRKNEGISEEDAKGMEEDLDELEDNVDNKSQQ